MEAALISLIAASITFVGTHFALSHPLRAPLVRVLGQGGFMLLYSLVAVGAIWWMAIAFRAVQTGQLGGSGTAGWIVATILTLPAMVLLVSSFAGNPALPAPGAEKQARQEPRGVFAVTRHPMMWGFALWAVAHVALWWSWRTNIVAIAILILALVGAHLQDRKKRALMGEAWEEWQAKTSYWPRWSALTSAGWKPWLAGALLWLAATYGHIHAAGIPAGVWRWLA